MLCIHNATIVTTLQNSVRSGTWYTQLYPLNLKFPTHSFSISLKILQGATILQYLYVDIGIESNVAKMYATSI